MIYEYIMTFLTWLAELSIPMIAPFRPETVTFFPNNCGGFAVMLNKSGGQHQLATLGEREALHRNLNISLYNLNVMLSQQGYCALVVRNVQDTMTQWKITVEPTTEYRKLEYYIQRLTESV